MDRLAGTTNLSRTDLKAEENVYKMTIKTSYGSNEFLVMPFGLCITLATFMSIMNSSFYEQMDECVIIYIDDILISFKSEDDYVSNFRRLLNKLRLYKLLANVKKSELFFKKLNLLDHVLSSEDICLNPKKIQETEGVL